MTRRAFLGVGIMSAMGLVGCGTGRDGQDTGNDGGNRLMRNEVTTVVVTEQETVVGNSAWCGTMQLCWNMIVDDMNGGNPVVFLDEAANTEEIDHLNAKTFTTDFLSEDHYYVRADRTLTSVRREIEKDLRERFDQESDVLDSVRWVDDPKQAEYLLYAMLYRKFGFEHPFKVGDGQDWFGDGGNYDSMASGVMYFSASDSRQRSQVEPLWYENPQSHAVRIHTKEGDDVVLVRSPEGRTLGEMYDLAIGKDTGHEAPLAEGDEFLCPNLDIDLQREFPEWSMSTFMCVGDDGKAEKLRISQAIQTLKLHLDNEGGEVKSEAIIDLRVESIGMGPSSSRRFRYDGRFAMFVVDSKAPDPTKPYVGVLVEDITKFQSNAKPEGGQV